TPCSANADCVAVGATICGGSRCTTSNARQGTPCTPPGAAVNATCGICINGASAGANCTTPANCGAGRLCVGGTNAGAACTVASQCPGSGGFCGCSTGICGFPGLATAPNQCDGGDTDCAAGGTPGPNDGQCQTGPTDFFCQPNATMISCVDDTECTAAGVKSCTGGGNGGAVCTVASECPGGTCDLDTCTGSKTRECFLDNGTIGNTDDATGAADPPVNDASDPTLAALFCIGPTASSAVNAAAGLPGLGRLELEGHAEGLP
ncbi:MAG: hypothetical protein ACREQL_01170, partial [Candidatus Binatia bacterium]